MKLHCYIRTVYCKKVHFSTKQTYIVDTLVLFIHLIVGIEIDKCFEK